MSRIPFLNNQTGQRICCGGARGVLLALMLILLLGTANELRGNGQTIANQTTLDQIANGILFPNSHPRLSPMQQRLLIERNADRQKKLVADTEKLLALATELNSQLKCSSNGSLTREQLHKVAKIQKLAHSVRENMITPIVPPTEIYTPYSPINP